MSETESSETEEEAVKPGVERYTGEYEMRGRCPGCDKKVVRKKEISAPSLAIMEERAEQWKPDFRHKKKECQTDYIFPVGTVVRIVGEVPVGYDAPAGYLYKIETYVSAEESDIGDRAMYLMETAPGQGSWGNGYLAPVENVRRVRTPKQQQEAEQQPGLEQVAKLIQNGMMRASEGDIEVYETRILTKMAEEGDFESENPFAIGVEFFARRDGGMSFGGTVRLTGLWPTDD